MQLRRRNLPLTPGWHLGNVPIGSLKEQCRVWISCDRICQSRTKRRFCFRCRSRTFSNLVARHWFRQSYESPYWQWVPFFLPLCYWPEPNPFRNSFFDITSTKLKNDKNKKSWLFWHILRFIFPIHSWQPIVVSALDYLVYSLHRVLKSQSILYFLSSGHHLEFICDDHVTTMCWYSKSWDPAFNGRVCYCPATGRNPQQWCFY